MNTKTLFLAFALVAASMAGYAQKPTYKKQGQPDALGWYVVIENKKFGYIDSLGNIVVPIVYDGARQYVGNFAQVLKDKKWGVVNREGNEICPPVYDGIKDFLGGFALVQRDGKWGAIDATGTVLCQPVYDIIENFGIFSPDFARVNRGGKWGIVDQQFKEIHPAQYGAIIFDEGLAPLKGNGKIGFIDKNCNMVIPAVYDDCAYFSYGSAAVKQNGSWGYIDREGKTLIPFNLNYEQCGAFSEGLIAVMQNKKWGYVDTNGQAVIPIKLKYDEVYGFSEGMAKVSKKDKFRFKYGFINRTGKEVIKPMYIMATDFENDVAIVSKDYVNLDVIAENQRAAAAMMASAQQIGAAGTGMMATSAASQAQMSQLAVNPGIVGPTGGNLQAQQQQQRWEQRWQQSNADIQNKYNSDMQRASTTGASVSNAGNLNTLSIVPEQILINKSGKELIPSKKRYVGVMKVDVFPGNCYLLAKSFSVDNGAVPLLKYGIYDVDKQKEVIPMKYSRFDLDFFLEKKWIIVADPKNPFFEFVPTEHKYGIIDYSDKVIIPLEHDIFDATVFAPHERILVGDMLKRKNTFSRYIMYTIEEASYGIIDYSGKVIIPKMICEGIEFIDNTFVMTTKESEKRYFDLDGKEIRKP